METQADRDKLIRARALMYQNGLVEGKHEAARQDNVISLNEKIAELRKLCQAQPAHWFYAGVLDSLVEEFGARYGSL